MEDWLHFAESFSPFITAGTLPDIAAEMWGLLRHAVLHYCRHSVEVDAQGNVVHNSFDEKDRRKAWECLLRFAVLAEKVREACVWRVHAGGLEGG